MEGARERPIKNPTYTRGGVATVTVAALLAGFMLGIAAVGGVLAFLGRLQPWQTSISVVVAFVAAAFAFLSTQKTQRITVMIKEQERIDEKLPGIRQCADVLSETAATLREIKKPRGRTPSVWLDSRFPAKETEPWDTIIGRQIPLAGVELRDDLTRLVRNLILQSRVLKQYQQELNQTQGEISRLPPDSSTDEVNDKVAIGSLIKASYESEEQKFAEMIAQASEFALTLESRVVEMQTRRAAIEQELGVYFQGK